MCVTKRKIVSVVTSSNIGDSRMWATKYNILFSQVITFRTSVRSSRCFLLSYHWSICTFCNGEEKICYICDTQNWFLSLQILSFLEYTIFKYSWYLNVYIWWIYVYVQNVRLLYLYLIHRYIIFHIRIWFSNTNDIQNISIQLAFKFIPYYDHNAITKCTGGACDNNHGWSQWPQIIFTHTAMNISVYGNQ